ncbi:helix-turn-helix transcriptional regulator [Galbibacter mesophilus]|uniref:helix-turn-helix transcriptional regulator n=1 Tax=Galbibacter mesophilus TaxID=379069 RepID=UPI00191CD5C1|nr:YafY family protein [Galbibacter mesophilus]MCM5663454.1 YafY family transcriptional regulator [Galbibacter mesophilus]
MTDNTLKKFDRIVAILIQLQSKKIVTAQELADRFGVSLRTIYRDVRTLETSGVPIISEAGTGYSIMEGYRLPPIMFTKEEASSFIAAEKLMQQYTDASLGKYFEAAMFKIKSVLRGSEKDWMSSLASQISIYPTQELFNKDVPNALEILFGGIAEKKQVFLVYEALHATSYTDRWIEPVGLFNENGFWYIMAYCHLRKDYRQFRTDRIKKISTTQKSFVLEHEPLESFLQKEANQIKTNVIIRVDKKVARYLSHNLSYYGLVSEKTVGNEVEMEFNTVDMENRFARWYLMFADYATIVQPESLKQRIKEIIRQAGERLS